MKLSREDIEMIYALKIYAYDHQDADDMIQDILLKILNNLEKFNSLPASEKRQYAMGSVRHWNIDKHRRGTKSGRVKYHVPIEFAEISAKPDVYATIELNEVMEKGSQHSFFPELMMYAAGYKCTEIAEHKNVRLNTILTRIRYCRIHLKK